MTSNDRLGELLRSLHPEAGIEWVSNDPLPTERSLRVPADEWLGVTRTLREDARFQFDLLSNVTGIDYLDSVNKVKTQVTEIVEGVEKQVEKVSEVAVPGYLEVVYHFYSTVLRHGPLVVRVRTSNRSERVEIPSVTPIWRSAEFQEREIYDLFGVRFSNHPDLRRILMWEGYEDHPMRRDYVEPDDYEYEPTPHDEVLIRAKEHSLTTRSPKVAS